MKVSIRDKEALLAVSPTALSAYARTFGWVNTDTYGEYSDVYEAEGLPEIIIPRVNFLGDYVSDVSKLIDVFATVADIDTLALYYNLVTAEYDVMRFRADVESSKGGSIAIDDGIELVKSAQEMISSAARSIHEPKPFYSGRIDSVTSDYMGQVRLGQTENGSYIVKLLSPKISEPKQSNQLEIFSSGEVGIDSPEDEPFERRITRRLAQALAATRDVIDKTAENETNAVHELIQSGASANLCEAIANAIDPFLEVNISLTWALTYPRETPSFTVRFVSIDHPILRKAAKKFRETEPVLDDKSFIGYVEKLQREEQEEEGSITVKVLDDGKPKTVIAELTSFDYEQAIQAHKSKSQILINGELTQKGKRWLLLNPNIVNVIEQKSF